MKSITCARCCIAPPGPFATHAPEPDQALGLQELCRTDHLPAARAAGGRGGAQWLRQEQHHGRRALGAWRKQSERTARRKHAGRDLQRQRATQAGQPRQRGARFRQHHRPGRRAVEQLCRDRRATRADAGRRQQLLHQRSAGAPPRRSGCVPGHRPGPARLRHHRPGHDQPHHRKPARRTAAVPGRSCRRQQVQGTPPRDREPAQGHAREPHPRRRHPARTEQQPREAGEPGRCRHQVPRAAGPGHAQAAPVVVLEGQRCGGRGGTCQGRCRRRHAGVGSAGGRTAPCRGPARTGAPSPLRRQRRAARQAGPAGGSRARGEPA